MVDANEELEDQFGKLTPEVSIEFDSMLRLYNIDAQELFFKWESYCMKMGSEDVKISLDTVKAFKKDVQDQFETQMRNKSKMQRNNATPKAPQRTAQNISTSDDMFGMLDGVVRTTPRTGPPSTMKRKLDKAAYETPLASKTSKLTVSPLPADLKSSAVKTSLMSKFESATFLPFSQRKNPGQIIETLNSHIPEPSLSESEVEDRESRIQLVVNVEVKRFSYRPMHQKLIEASEYLDDRIDDFALAMQQEHNIPDEEFGNPASVSATETTVVGRIVSDSLDGKLNMASLFLESSRRMGAGARVKLKLDTIKSFSFFPGMLVALKGTNPNGDYFAVNSILDPPAPKRAASSVDLLETNGRKLEPRGLNIVSVAGPYTTDDNLLFEPLEELCNKVAITCPEVLILTGPFIDTEHPLVASGNFDVDLDDGIGGAVEALFRERITPHLAKLPKTLVILVPSTRDAISKHVSFPQEPFHRAPLALPKSVKLLPNPCIFSINEVVIGVSSADILFHLSREEVQRNPSEQNTLVRLSSHLISQRHFYPLFPPPAKSALNGVTGLPVDVAWLKLCEMNALAPDILIVPSALTAFIKVVNSIVTINPGSLSKRMGSGTYSTMTIIPRDTSETDDPHKPLLHKLYNRSRVDIRRI